MAILKHIKSRNANYSDAIDYLLFQHDESTGKKIKDEMGRSLLRDEFYIKTKKHLKSKATIISSVLIRMIDQNVD